MQTTEQALEAAVDEKARLHRELKKLEQVRDAELENKYRLTAELLDVQTKLDNCRQEVQRLKQDLKGYGEHSPRCYHFGECRCGLNEALGLGPAVDKEKP